MKHQKTVRLNDAAMQDLRESAEMLETTEAEIIELALEYFRKELFIASKGKYASILDMQSLGIAKFRRMTSLEMSEANQKYEQWIKSIEEEFSQKKQDT